MSTWLSFLTEVRILAVGAASITWSALVTAHVVLHKRDSRAAVAWVGLIWLVPFGGGLLYAVFGVNRIRRAAGILRQSAPRLSGSFAQVANTDTVLEVLPERNAHLASLGRLVDQVTRRPLTMGNSMVPLEGGDAAYAEMLAAIAGAQRTVALSTYIFSSDAAGHMFIDALAAARARGVQVRVLVDAVGARYSWPPAHRLLRRLGVPVARFLRTRVSWRAMFMNLRNHRKILVVDGAVGFTGGMNLRVGHMLDRAPRRPVQDVHFRLQGPVVRHLMEVFAEDWAFTTGELLSGADWFPELAPAGPAVARGINDGPDEDFEQLYWVVAGAISSATRSVCIATPYFLPDQSLIRSLVITAMRGVSVRVLLPAVNNLPFVAWAAQAQLWQVVKRNVEVRMSPGPFDHSKALIVDEAWSLIGSANLDPRSLRLNFEFNVEAYDPAFAARMTAWFEAKWETARPVTAHWLDHRPLWMRLRDGVARLASPFL